MEKLHSVQALRGVAAIMVVLFHACGAASGDVLLAPFHRFGAAGVDIFFVISGFIMVLTSRNKDVWSFLRARVRRIVPIYWLLTGLTVVLVAMGLRSGSFGLAEIFASLAFYAWPGPAGAAPVLHVGWTLNYEMYFYLIMAAAMPLGRWKLPALVVALVVIALLHLTGPGTVQGQFYTDPIILEFAFGALIGQAYLSGHNLPRPVGLAAVLAGTALLVLMPELVADWRVVMWGVPAALIVYGVVFLERAGLSVKFPWIGDSSYSLYLSHVFVLAVAAKLVPPQGDVFVVVATLLSVAAGIAVWAGLEAPISRLLGRPKRVPAAQAVPS